MTNHNLYIVAVTGGRDYSDRKHVNRVLYEIHVARTIDVLVHGNASGADTLADDWAIDHLVQSARFHVPGVMWNKLGRSAGPARNLLMLECAQPNLLVAFPGGTGTASCVAMAKRLKIELRDERNNG